jgi:DivIVA domain-containing protein
MALTPADVHNVAFSRPRIGKRGYNEQEVDLFIDLVEQELTRHIAEDAQLRNLNAELRGRDGGLQKREAELAEREARLVEREAVLRRHVRRHEGELCQQNAELAERDAGLAEREAGLAQRGTPLRQQIAQLRYREAQVAHREAQLEQHKTRLAQREAELGEWQTRLRQQEAELRQRPDRRPQQLRAALAKSAAGNGTSRLEEMRAVASVHARHDMERMAIRAVTDTRGNTVTETVHERTRRSRVDHGGPGVAAAQSTELEQLKEENAELARSVGLLKAAAALLAAALDGRNSTVS